MTLIESLVLGIVQGLTEFIPVSSSGHLELIPKFFNWGEPSTGFITFLHFGTLLALFIYYRKTLWGYLLSLFRYIKRQNNEDDAHSLKMIRNIIIATIPAGVLGFAISELIQNTYDSPENARLATILTASAMILVGVIFIFANRIFINKKFSFEKLTSKKALIVGLAQALAIFRGTSRSGITLLAGQAVGLNRVSAAEFGFLISIPITLVAATFGTIELIKADGTELVNNLPVYLVGLFTSFIFGYIAIKFMISFLKRRGLRDFGIYRIIFGVLALLVLL